MRSSVRVHVSGEFACFTRPEHKMERVSYPVMTPSAARGILHSVYHKPQFNYLIEAIEVVKAGSFVSMGRNELDLAPGHMTGKMPIAIETQRLQRTGSILEDVAYIIECGIELRPEKHDDREPFDPVALLGKHRGRLVERLTRGKLFRQPCLGMREFSARVRLATDDDGPDMSLSMDVGAMFLDFRYDRPDRRPEFFDARVIDGRMLVPRPGWMGQA